MSESVALHGNLKDFGIGEVFQLIGQQRKTGVLEVATRDERIELCFDRGGVVSAAPLGPDGQAMLGDMLVRCGLLTREQLEAFENERTATLQSLRQLLVDRAILDAAEIREIQDLLTRETIFRLLRRNEGSFHFTARAVTHDRDASGLLGAEQILMDGLRMVDEWKSFAQRIPSEEIVFQRVGSFDAYRESVHGESDRQLAAAERVLLLVDGRQSVRRVIDLSRLGTFEATGILASLRKAGVIEPVAPERLERAQAPRAEKPHAARRAWSAVLVPFALLLLLAVSSHLPPPVPSGAPLFGVSRSPFEEARLAFEQRRVRNALEAYRFAHGAWPQRLEELVAAGLLESAALTPSSGRPYYYKRRGEDMVLLAPER